MMTGKKASAGGAVAGYQMGHDGGSYVVAALPIGSDWSHTPGMVTGSSSCERRVLSNRPLSAAKGREID